MAQRLAWATPAALPASILLHMPDDGRRYELVYGQLIGEAMTSASHGGLCNRLGQRLANYAEATHFPHAIVQHTLFDMTPPGVADRTVLAPDVAVMRDLLTPRAVPITAPLIAIEVVSPSQSLADLHPKAQIYRDAGTDEVWLIDEMTRVVEIWNAHGTTILTDQQDRVSALIPGFTCSIAWLIGNR